MPLQISCIAPPSEAVKITLGDWTWAFILWHVALVLGLLFFDRWRRSIPRTLQLVCYNNLLLNQAGNATTAIRRSARVFLGMYEGYQKTLLSRKRRLLTAISVLLFSLILLDCDLGIEEDISPPLSLHLAHSSKYLQ